MRPLLIAAALALGAAFTPASAGEAFPGAAALDKVEATYVRHNREHRMWEIDRNMQRQERYGHRYRDRGYGDGRGYRRQYGGPPPWAPAYGRRHQERYDRW